MINRPDSPSDLVFDSRVIVSTEQECLTSVECADTPVGRGTDRGARASIRRQIRSAVRLGTPSTAIRELRGLLRGDAQSAIHRETQSAILHQTQTAILRFLEVMASLAPSLPSAAGFFNAYGRVYLDCGDHIELAAPECDSPYALAQVVDCQHQLARKAVEQLRDEGITLILANNNHSDLLQAKTSIWGTHENFLVALHPTEFTAAILPFLVTRIYAGAGGIHHPSGDFLAAVRPLFMKHAEGGGTTSQRAIHSTCREEHHMGPRPSQYRYHLILGDGHRSQFNLSLQFGATALALKAIAFDRSIASRVARVCPLPLDDSWVKTLQQFNVLAKPGEELHVDPRVIAVQRIYLETSSRWAATLPAPPQWIGEILQDWGDVLDAMAEADHEWLSERLDTYTKHRFYSQIVGDDWESLVGDEDLFAELALLDQRYHEFCNPESPFESLERDGLLDHRIVDSIAPGDEPEPFIPDINTRAATRARFIREHAGHDGITIDWAWAYDMKRNRRKPLLDPFAEEFGAWENSPGMPF